MFVFKFISLLCLIQGFRFETIDDVVADLTPKLVSQKAHTIEVIVRDGEKIGRTKSNIGRTVGKGERSIGEQLDQLGNLIDEAREEAEAKGKDVENCIRESNNALLLLDLNGFRKCRNDEELNGLGDKLGKLGELVDQISGAFDRVCKKENTANGLRSCVEAVIDKTKNETDRTEEEIATLCNEAEKNASVCVEKTLNELSNGIDEIAHNLKSCIESILN